MMTKEELAAKFIDAGYARVNIEDEDLAVLGIKKVPKSIKTWWAYCQWVYKKITKEEMPRCHLRGRGFRSQYFGEQVAEVIRGG